jgi:hypothetical protein
MFIEIGKQGPTEPGEGICSVKGARPELERDPRRDARHGVLERRPVLVEKLLISARILRIEESDAEDQRSNLSP